MRYFRDYNPAVTALYFVLCAAVVMFTQEPALLILSFAGGFGYMMTFECKRSPGGHIFRAILFLTLTLINPIFSHNGKTPPVLNERSSAANTELKIWKICIKLRAER